MGWLSGWNTSAECERIERQVAELVQQLEPGLRDAGTAAAALAAAAERRGYLWAKAAPLVGQAARRKYPALRGTVREALAARATERLVEVVLARVPQDMRRGDGVRRAA